MTETEAKSFISDVLKGYWPDWEPTDVIYSLWVWKLRRFDYGKAKQALGEWFSEVDYTKKTPPINKILKFFILQEAHDENRRGARRKPAKVFEVFCEDWQPNHIPGGPPIKRHYSAWSASLAELKARDPHEIEQEAERVRQDLINRYSGNWVVNRLWMQYFEEGSIPI